MQHVHKGIIETIRANIAEFSKEKFSSNVAWLGGLCSFNEVRTVLLRTRSQSSLVLGTAQGGREVL